MIIEKYFGQFLIKTCVVGTHYSCLNEMILMICLHKAILIIIYNIGFY